MGNLVRLVDDLLDVSRITRGTMELRKEEVELVTVVRNALTVARPVVEARRHDLSVTLAADELRMHADPTRLEQVVVNVLTNAAKYTEPGGRLSLRLTREETSGVPEAVLSVSDSGRGIPVHMLDKVFDVFVQVAPTLDRSTGGLGLGLTLVKRLVEMHGGRVCARSEGPGQGSEFEIRVPLATGAQGNVPEPALEPEQLTEASVHRRRVLLVEDSEDLRETLADFLKSSGHDVTMAADGLEGFARALDSKPDLLLIDVGLPGMDGYELARRLRAEPAGRHLFLVALTGYGGPDAKRSAQEAGFDLHLTKPVSNAELRRVLDRDLPASY
jgi:CheY-like chemotaxis protein